MHPKSLLVVFLLMLLRPDLWGVFKVSPAFTFQRDAKSVPIPAGLADRAQPAPPTFSSFPLPAGHRPSRRYAAP